MRLRVGLPALRATKPTKAVTVFSVAMTFYTAFLANHWNIGLCAVRHVD